ncbi:hypothetical protein D9M71_754480 [compost metagenome]
MAVIDIKKSYRHISPEELRSYAYSGHLCCGSLDISDFLEYIFQDTYSQRDLEEAFEDGKREALESQGGINVCEECQEEY